MSKTATYPVISAEARPKLGSRYSARLRAEGKVPAVLYGHKLAPEAITLVSKELEFAFAHESHLIDVKIGGKSQHVLVKDVQWDTYGRHITHADLERVNLDETVSVKVELILTGESEAMKQAGAVLIKAQNKITIRCQASAIPNHIEQSIAGLAARQPLTVADLKLPAGITAVDNPTTMVAIISTKKEAEPVAATPAEGAAPASPEVIKKGKTDEEGAEAGKAPAAGAKAAAPAKK